MLARPKEVAERLNIEVQTLRDYAVRGLIPFETTPLGHRRYDPDLVEEALRRLKTRRFAPLTAGGEGDVLVSRSDRPVELGAGWEDALAIETYVREDEDSDNDWAAPAPFLGVAGSGTFLLDARLVGV